MGTSTIACRHNYIHISKDKHLQTYGMNGVTMAAQDANTVTYVTTVKNQCLVHTYWIGKNPTTELRSHMHLQINIATTCGFDYGVSQTKHTKKIYTWNEYNSEWGLEAWYLFRKEIYLQLKEWALWQLKENKAGYRNGIISKLKMQTLEITIMRIFYK